MRTAESLPGWYRAAIFAYDWVYRVAHGLNTPASEVGPVLRVEIRRSHGSFRLADGPVVRFGDRIGFLHVNNDRVVDLRSDGLSPIAIGLEFRRRLIASLRSLAALSQPEGRLADVRAYAATTIFHEGLGRLGFEAEPGGLRWPKVVAAYQRALLMSMHTGSPVGLRAVTYHQAERVWISRQKLIRLYAPPVDPGRGRLA
jgi:peptidoglycan-N-acetylglucosamine deacetylase